MIHDDNAQVSNMVQSTKKLGLGMVALAVAAVLWLALRADAVTVQAGNVEILPLTVMIEEQGRTRARDPFLVAAPINGRLLRPALEAGDAVQTGQVIARIAVAPDDRRATAVAQANVAAAEARREAAAATLLDAEGVLARARNEEERRAELFKTGVATAEEIEHYRQLTDSAAARVGSLRASLQATEAEVISARSLLLGSDDDNDAGILAVTSPVDGTVYRVFEESERVVQAGTPLYSLSHDNALEIVVDLLTQEAVRVQPGQPLQITGWGGNDMLTGSVMRVEPQAFTKISALGVEEQRVNVIGSLPDVPASLGAEYRVDVGIVVDHLDAALTLPASAAFQREGRWYCYVIDDGRARLREFTNGLRNRDYLQVVAGIVEGEQVVLFPSSLITDGVAVAVVD